MHKSKKKLTGAVLVQAAALPVFRRPSIWLISGFKVYLVERNAASAA